MYIDAQQQYSIAQALVATAVSTNAIDHSQGQRVVGIGEPLVIALTVGVGAVGGGTLSIALQTDTTSAFGAPVTVTTTPAIPAATLVAGYKFAFLVPNIMNMARWSRLNFTLVTMTSITLTAWLALASEVENVFYVPAGATVQ